MERGNARVNSVLIDWNGELLRQLMVLTLVLRRTKIYDTPVAFVYTQNPNLGF